VARRYETISFLSDLGTADGSAGVVRAVLRDLAPHATVIDLTHEVPPFDVRAGSLALARAVAYVPSGVVVAAVDPGAGTDRRIVAIEVAGGEGVVLGPDNGVLAPAVAMAGGAGRAVVLDRDDHHLPSHGATFAARDVLAPVAAALCNGVDLGELGSPIDADLLVPGIVPLSREEGGVVLCEVLWVDRFGNCQLNVDPADVAAWGDRIRVSSSPVDPRERFERVAVVSPSFAGIGTGAIGLVADAHGLLAIALDRRSASAELLIGAGDQIVLAPLPDDGEQASGPVATPVRLRHDR